MSSLPKANGIALLLYAIVTLFSFPHEMLGGRSMDLGLALAWFGPAALIVGISGQTPARATRIAFAASMLSHSLLFHWFFVVTVQYGGMPSWLGLLAPLVPALYVSLFTALFAWLWTWVGTNSRAPILAGAVLWVAVDWARGHFLGGFPWATLGYALHLDLPLLVWTRWAGVYILSFFAAATGVALGRAWLNRTSKDFWALGLTVAGIVVAHLVGLWMSPGPFESKETIRIAAVQGNVDQGEKWDRARRDRIFQSYLNLSRQAAEDGAQWILWPETAVPGLIEAEPEFSNQIGLFAREYNVSMIVGGTGVEFDSASRRFSAFFDSAFLFDQNGVFRDRYDKTHLVPFGEYVPLRAFFGRFFKALASGLSDLDVSAGKAPRTLAIEMNMPAGTWLQAGVPICYELLFPDLVRRFGAGGAGVLLAITNDAWYGRTGAPHQFLAMTALRAAENGRWVVRAANTGISAIIDANGRVRERSELFEPAVLVSDVPVARSQPPTLYARVGDVFAGACVFISVGLMGRQFVGSRGSRAAGEREA